MSASDSESSDSSNEFLVPANQIDLDSTFFKPTAKKTNLKKATPVVQESSDESDDDFDYSSEANVSSAELLSQVLKNLENAKNQSFGADTSQSEASTSFAGDQNASYSRAGDDLSQEINDLLMRGESASTLSKEADTENEDDEDSKEEKYAIPEKGVQIHLPGENLMFDRKKKKQQDLQKLLQNKINHRIRSCQLYTHKTGLLCWLAYGFHLNKIINDPDLLGITLSLVSSNNYPKGRPDLNYIEKFTKWFAGKFKISEHHKAVVFSKDLLIQRVADKTVYNYIELVLLYIATLRGMGMHCRLVISLQPPRMKPTSEQLFKIPKDETNSEPVKTEKKEKENSKDTKKGAGKGKSKVTKKKIKSEEESPSKIIPANSSEALKVASAEAKKKAAAILKGKGIGKKQETDNKSKVAEENKANQDKKPTRRAAKKVEIEKDDSDDEDKETASNMTIARKLRSRVAKATEPEKKATKSSSNKKETETKSKTVKKSTKRTRTPSSEEISDSDEESEYSTDDEYIEKKPKKRVAKTTQKNDTIASKLVNKTKDKSRKLLSSDDDKDGITNSYNVWIEVYVESEESWISVNILDKKIHCVSEIYKKAGRPVLYVVAWNAASSVKDVTRRYCPQWLTDTRKKRVDEKWWKECLYPWEEEKTAISKAEDEQLLQRELEQPLPKTVGECKGHPLYALVRHLLKFEALYPPDAVPLGHLKTGEAIYSRHCVHTLYSRETWLKNARVVKPAQEAYKIVKSLPKYDKLSGQKIKDLPLELFGKWQTTQYVPPEAKDGKVPRNEYGNVDLFKKCMLPKGTVFIELPGLNRIARKLNIDCAPACTGFSFGCRGALPVFEGSVVCEEYEEVIRAAWEEEQIAARKREQERRDKRIYGNWKKLIKGLLIRERLAVKYNFREEEDDDRAEEADESEAISTAKKLAAAMKKTEKVAAKALTTRSAGKRGKQQSGNTKKKIKS